MRMTLVVAAVLAFLTCGAIAQNTEPATPPSGGAQTQASPQAPTAAANQPANTPRIAPGSVIPVQLTKTVDAKKAKTGDEVVAKVTQDMRTQTGEVLVPKDTKVIGHVTEVQARHKDEKESQLGIAFNQAVLKNEPVQLPMSIQAVIGIENNAAENNSPNAAPGGPAPSPSSTSSASGTSPMAGRTPTGNSGQGAGTAPSASDSGTAAQSASKRPPINGQTQGVIGIPNLNLAPASNSAQGTVLTSDKNNVKLENGTMLLLKVSQQ